MAQLCILGRQPKIGLAELESLYGSDQITPLGQAAFVTHPSIDFDRLGGCVKLADHVTTISTSNPQKAFEFCRRMIVECIDNVPDGKIKLGVSLYGAAMPVQRLNANVLSLKKIIKNHGRSVRVVPNTALDISSAQTCHNNLTSPTGCELVFVVHDQKTYIGKVTRVQDIDSYTKRDRQRPKRDAFNGMLPPKLAQTIINLAAGDTAPSPKTTILDPFCGTGVILQEAILMDFAAYGTDLNPRMIDFSRQNLAWLADHYDVSPVDATLKAADAMTFQWEIPPRPIIACEGYLGRPIGGQHPTPEQLQAIIHDCNIVMRGFLKNIVPQLPSKTRLCIAAPCWSIEGKTYHLPVIDELDKLGYNRKKFAYVQTSQLIYRRDTQITGRELLVLETA